MGFLAAFLAAPLHGASIHSASLQVDENGGWKVWCSFKLIETLGGEMAIFFMLRAVLRVAGRFFYAPGAVPLVYRGILSFEVVSNSP